MVAHRGFAGANSACLCRRDRHLCPLPNQGEAGDQVAGEGWAPAGRDRDRAKRRMDRLRHRRSQRRPKAGG